MNSPLDAPVIRRRPSGVHVRQNTGQRILLVATYSSFKYLCLIIVVIPGIVFMNIYNRLAVSYFGEPGRDGIARLIKITGWRYHLWIVTDIGLKIAPISMISLPNSCLK